jgi:hypothetical protein
MILVIFVVRILNKLRVPVLQVFCHYLAFLRPKQQLITVFVLVPHLRWYFLSPKFKNVPRFIYLAPLFECLIMIYIVKSGADWYYRANLRVV